MTTDDKAEREQAAKFLRDFTYDEDNLDVDEKREQLEALTCLLTAARRGGEATAHEDVVAYKADVLDTRKALSVCREYARDKEEACAAAERQLGALQAQLTRLTEAARDAEQQLARRLSGSAPVLTPYSAAGFSSALNTLRAALAQAPAADGEGA